MTKSSSPSKKRPTSSINFLLHQNFSNDAFDATCKNKTRAQKPATQKGVLERRLKALQQENKELKRASKA